MHEKGAVAVSRLRFFMERGRADMIDELGIAGFRLKQSRDFLKLGTDAMLLSEFAHVRRYDRVCDLGCGNGAITVLLAARHPDISLTGVERLPGAAALAEENAALNGITGRMRVLCADFREIEALLPPGSFHVVVSNPPYLKFDGGLHTENPNLLAARMETAGDITDLCRAAAYLLRYGGNFSVVYRPERLAALFCALAQFDLAPKRMRMVQNRRDGAPSLVLVEARKCGGEGLRVLPTLLIRDESGAETEELRRIYRRDAAPPRA